MHHNSARDNFISNYIKTEATKASVFVLFQTITQSILYLQLAQEALEAYKVVTQAYANSFGIGKAQIHCYTSYFGDIGRHAYISVEGLWELESEYHPNKTFTVTLTPDGIFTCLVAGEKNELFKAHDFGFTQEEAELSHATNDFREFIANCKSELEKKQGEQSENDEEPW